MENKDLKIKKCFKCGAIVRVLEDCNCEGCGIICCGEQMRELIPNTVEASLEKHIPTYEIKDGKLLVKVNHVMDEEHYIEWISIVSENKEITKYFKPGEEPKLQSCKYKPGTKIYAYCNKHGLWKNEVK